MRHIILAALLTVPLFAAPLFATPSFAFEVQSGGVPMRELLTGATHGGPRLLPPWMTKQAKPDAKPDAARRDAHAGPATGMATPTSIGAPFGDDAQQRLGALLFGGGPRAPDKTDPPRKGNPFAAAR